MVRDGFAAPYKQLVPGLQAIPTVGAQIPLGGSALTQWCQIEQLVISNPTAGAITLTIADAGGHNLFQAVSFAANSHTVFNYFRPIKLIGTTQWVASAAGLIAEVKGFYL